VLVIGAMGHAKEILDVLDKQNGLSNLVFFDNVTPRLPERLYDTFPIIRTDAEAKEIFEKDPAYILGIGGCLVRYKLTQRMNELGGRLTSVISNTASIGNFNVYLGEGLNIMHGTFISNDVSIGTGSLINANSLIHHDVSVGQFCEISPGAVLTGSVQIGDFTSIGSGAVILPKVKVGANVIIGAGAVVTKDVSDNSVAVGVPAKANQINKSDKFKS
jgi:sugar O-acyltransferase (sialic acid O-acetyltransferase NeuD family)